MKNRIKNIKQIDLFLLEKKLVYRLQVWILNLQTKINNHFEVSRLTKINLLLIKCTKQYSFRNKVKNYYILANQLLSQITY